MDTNTELEAMVDSKDIDGVLADLEAICYAKAEHVRSNWQDENLAKVWERHGAAIAKFITTIGKLPTTH